jgi:hypothetical protein
MATLFSFRKIKNIHCHLPTPINIELTQTVDTDAGNYLLGLHCSSSKIYYPDSFAYQNEKDHHRKQHAYQFGLNYLPVSREHSFDITFTDVTIPAYHSPQYAPAIADINLGILNNGQYELFFRDSTHISSAILLVSDSEYNISNLPSNFVSFRTTTLKRLHKSTITVAIGWQDDSSAIIANSFVDSLMFYGAKQYKGPIGDYGYFYLDSSFSREKINGPFHSKKFIFTYTGDFNNIPKLIHSYQSRTNNLFDIYLTTYRGTYVIG